MIMGLSQWLSTYKTLFSAKCVYCRWHAPYPAPSAGPPHESDRAHQVESRRLRRGTQEAIQGSPRLEWRAPT